MVPTHKLLRIQSDKFLVKTRNLIQKISKKNWRAIIRFFYPIPQLQKKLKDMGYSYSVPTQ